MPAWKMRANGKLTVRFTDGADAEFMDGLAAVCEMFGAIYWNHNARTLVVLASDARAAKTLRAQLAQLVADQAPLSWQDAAC